MEFFKVQALKAGDIVAISPAHQSKANPYIVDCVVLKVNGHGHVTVKKGDREVKFDKYGNEYGRYKGSSFFDCIVENDMAKKRNAECKQQHEACKRVNEILTLIAACKTYGNDYRISPEVKEKLVALVAAI